MIRLDPTDAKFVDVIHTDGRSLILLVLCRHRRATQYFIESINSACTFRGYRCKSYEDFRQGDCMPCTEWGCGYMGFNADRVKPPTGTSNVKYFLRTGYSTPFCRHNYQINIMFGIVSTSSKEKGKVKMNIIGSKGQLGETALTDKSVSLIFLR
ncbi:hypothetical protein CHS0354_016357 [Potamilus streckersoni]|uniref:PLAT domain-containing protein n=1 Tax=Potamilus streckersoni TaxID=2493646 RepID=A0AAE0RL30_9BIVA|nr:hypothetical protein CHS0354_016357 [Potamilus streckersoni]